MWMQRSKTSRKQCFMSGLWGLKKEGDGAGGKDSSRKNTLELAVFEKKVSEEKLRRQGRWAPGSIGGENNQKKGSDPSTAMNPN